MWRSGCGAAATAMAWNLGPFKKRSTFEEQYDYNSPLQCYKMILVDYLMFHCFIILLLPSMHKRLSLIGPPAARAVRVGRRGAAYVDIIPRPSRPTHCELSRSSAAATMIRSILVFFLLIVTCTAEKLSSGEDVTNFVVRNIRGNEVRRKRGCVLKH